MSAPKLTLYTYWRSSSAYRVRLALGFKGIAHERVFVNLLESEQKKEGYVAKSPMGYVPCLTIDGADYVESVAIVELLEDLFPEPALYPKKPEERARVRALVEIVNAGTQPLQNLTTLAKLGDDKEKRVDWMRHFMGRGLTAFESLASPDGPFAFGATFSAADVFLLPQLYAARRFEVDVSRFPRILRAEEAAKALPFFAAATPEAQPDAKT